MIFRSRNLPRRTTWFVSALLVTVLALPASALGDLITPTDFVVDRGSYRYWVFEVSRSAQVHGDFYVKDKSDISVLLIDESEFDSFRKGGQVRSYYSSGRVAGGRINIQLRVGRYLIIFDNQFSPFSAKQISANLALDVQ